ncbi:transposase [Holospora undulata]|uniref:transposase n=1 Tax=Holospora undulata TaxID=1169117 RepID=UPI00032D84D0
MDNAAFHKGKDLQKILEDAGHSLLYLPPYFPDLNQIEKKWAHPKHIRKTLTCSIDHLFQFHFS